MQHYSPNYLRLAIILILLSFYSTITLSQNSVSIGTVSTNPKAVLWLSGTNQGIIIPIVTNKTNVSAGPTEKGMVIFDDSDKKVYFYDGTAWNQVGGSGAAGGQGITINGNTVQLNSTLGSTFNLSNTAPTDKGQLLVWDGTKWNATLAPSSTGQTLSWDNTNGKWTLANASLTLAGDVSGPSNNTTIASTSGNNIVAALNNAATTTKVLPAQISPGSPNQFLTTSSGNVAVWANLPTASGTVTNIATGTGLTGGPITTTGTIALANTGVAVGTYGSETQIPQMTVNAQGQITSASNISLALAGSTTTGFLSTADWNTFNNKLAGTLTNGNIFIGNASNVATGVPMSGDVTISNSGAVTIQPNKITTAKILDGEIVDIDINASANIADTKLATISTPGKVSGSAITFGTIGGTTNINTTGNVTATNLAGNGAAITDMNASNLTSGTVPTARIDVGTTANKIVQLDATGKLPAVDGSQLTNLPAGMETDPNVQAINGLIKSNGSIISAATAGVDYLTPTGNGFALTSLNANNITSGTLSIVNGGTGATTPQLARTSLGLGNLAILSTVTTNEITDGTIVGSDISASAAIPDTKLAMISSAGKVSGSAITSGTISGSTSISSTGNILTTGTLSTGAATVSTLTIGNSIWPANASGILTNDGAGNLTWAQTGGGGTVKSITKGVGLVAGEAITTTGTIDINVGTGAKQIIQLDEEGRLPAVDGSQLTNLPAGAESDPIVKSINGIVKSNGVSIGNAIAGIDYLSPNGNGSFLTNLNANNLSSGTIPTARIDVGTTANKIVQLDAAGKLPAIDGSRLTNLPAGTESDPIVKAITGLVKSNGTTLSAAVPGTDYLITNKNITLQGDVVGSGTTSITTTIEKINGSRWPNDATGFLKNDGDGHLSWVAPGTTANKIVQLDGNGKLPAVDGSQLTNLPMGTERDPMVKAINGLVKSNGTTISSAIAGTDYLIPNGSGAGLTNLNAGNVSSGTLSITNGGTGSTTAPAARTALGLGSLSILNAVASGDITDNSIIDNDINANAAIAGNKIVPNFGDQSVSTKGALTTGSAGQFTIDAVGNITKINNISTSFPSEQGEANSILTNDGEGNLTWTTGRYWGQFGNELIEGERIGSINNAPLPFITNDIERMRIDENGNVGIGTINPKAKFQIGSRLGLHSAASNQTYDAITRNIFINGSDVPFYTNTGFANAILMQDGLTEIVVFPSGSANASLTSPTTKLSIATAGIGINNSGAPLATLDIAGNIRIADGTQGANKVLMSDANGQASWQNVSGWGLNGNTGTNPSSNFIGTVDNNAMRFRTNNLERFTILPTGQIGIGTNTPSSLLHATQTLTGSTPMVIIENGHATGDASLRFSGGSTHYTIGSDASSGSFVISNNSTGIGTNDRLTINSSGYIGIGTNNPRYPLDVVTSNVFNSATTVKYFNSNTSGSSLSNNTLNNVDVAIVANGGYLSTGTGNSGGFYVTSDERIKRKVGISDSRNDLAMLMKLKVTDYMYVDSLKSGNMIVKGVFAQQTESVYPQAVSKQTNFIPNIYALSNSTSYDESGKTLHIIMAKPHGLKKGDKVKLISSTSGEKQGEVIAADNFSFTINNWNENSEKIFVYGKEVIDFRIVDYDRLFTLNISATQEIVKLLEMQQKLIEELKSKVNEISLKNAAMEEKLSWNEVKENEVNLLRSEIEKIKAAMGLTSEGESRKNVKD
jgi:trimeric autotransporter adhesin